MSREIAVKVKNLTKSFKIPLEAHNGIKQKLINTLKGVKGHRDFTPLNDVSFEIEKGEFFGIVGRNGSGKSTLLKTIAGIYTPNGGEVHVNGKLVPFIELGVGFNPELTGRENVFLNGALLGFSRSEMVLMYDEIVDFAELHDFMEERLKNYSSGMQVRLAFSIAIRAQGEILLLDEVLAVGDEAFQRKCFEYFAKLKKNKKTVILVTHDMGSVRRFCSRAMLINNGEIQYIGTTRKVAKLYEDINMPKQNNKKLTRRDSSENQYVSTSVKLTNEKNESIENIDSDQNLNLKVYLGAKSDLQNVYCNLSIHKSTGEQVFWKSTDSSTVDIKKDQQYAIQIQIQNVFAEGEYYVNINVTNSENLQDYLVKDEAVTFRIVGGRENGWTLNPKYEITTEYIK